MKKSSIIIMTLLLLGLLFLPSCQDIYLTTQVNRDGSLDKTIVFQEDSTEIAESPLADLIGKGWDTTWIYPEEEKSKMVATRHFRNYRDFNRHMNPKDSTIRFRFEAKLKKRFRWFFTYFDYQETIIATNPFTRIDWKDYLTPGEIRLIRLDEEQREQDSSYQEEAYDDTEERFEEYLTRNVFEEFFAGLVSIPDLEEETGYSSDKLISMKDSIYHHVVEESDGSDLEDILDEVGIYLNQSSFSDLYVKHRDLFSAYQDRITFFERAWDDSYHFTIRLPGLLMDTNSDQIEGNECSWDLDFFDFFFEDLTMQTETRVINIWAFVVAGIILLVALTSLIISLFKRK